jgi:hypothetical protein
LLGFGVSAFTADIVGNRLHGRRPGVRVHQRIEGDLDQRPIPAGNLVGIAMQALTRFAVEECRMEAGIV